MSSANNEADGTRILTESKGLTDINKVQYNAFTLNRALCRLEIATQDFQSGVWTLSEIPQPPALAPRIPQKVLAPIPDHPKYPNAAYIANSIVYVGSTRPIMSDGMQTAYTSHWGIVLNEELGLVLVSRDVVISELCNARIIFFGSIVLPADVVYVHPVFGYAVLKYDASLIQGPVQRARLSDKEITAGESALYFQLNDGWKLDLSPAFVSGTRMITVAPDYDKESRAANLEVLNVSASLSSHSLDGAGLISEDGTVQALWCGGYCTPVASLIPILRQLEAGENPQTRLLGASFDEIDLMDAITMGIPEGRAST